MVCGEGGHFFFGTAMPPFVFISSLPLLHRYRLKYFSHKSDDGGSLIYGLFSPLSFWWASVKLLLFFCLCSNSANRFQLERMLLGTHMFITEQECIVMRNVHGKVKQRSKIWTMFNVQIHSFHIIWTVQLVCVDSQCAHNANNKLIDHIIYDVSFVLEMVLVSAHFPNEFSSMPSFKGVI